MSFGALPFLAFFLVVLALHRSLRGDRLRKDLLLVASYVFYAAWDWRFLGLIAGSTLVDYLCGLGIARATDHGRRR
ncbi:MAG: MBOAT family protein, partial [Planctomycetota bacterium]